MKLLLSLLAFLCLACSSFNNREKILGTWEINIKEDSLELIVSRTFKKNGTVKTQYLGSMVRKAQNSPFSDFLREKTYTWAIKDGKLFVDPSGQNFELYQIRSISKKEMRLINLFDAQQREIVWHRKE